MCCIHPHVPHMPPPPTPTWPTSHCNTPHLPPQCTSPPSHMHPTSLPHAPHLPPPCTPPPTPPVVRSPPLCPTDCKLTVYADDMLLYMPMGKIEEYQHAQLIGLG